MKNAEIYMISEVRENEFCRLVNEKLQRLDAEGKEYKVDFNIRNLSFVAFITAIERRG